MILSDYLWFLVVAIGPVLLAFAMIYALLRRRRLSREEKDRQDKATREVYRGER